MRSLKARVSLSKVGVLERGGETDSLYGKLQLLVVIGSLESILSPFPCSPSLDERDPINRSKERENSHD